MVIGLEHGWGWGVGEWGGGIYILQKAMQIDRQEAKSIVLKFPEALKGPWALWSEDQRCKGFLTIQGL